MDKNAKGRPCEIVFVPLESVTAAKMLLFLETNAVCPPFDAENQRGCL